MKVPYTSQFFKNSFQKLLALPISMVQPPYHYMGKGKNNFFQIFLAITYLGRNYISVGEN